MYTLIFQEYKQKCKIQCFIEQNKVSKERSKKAKKIYETVHFVNKIPFF